MKLFIRILLVIASLCMVIGNWNGSLMAYAASGLFLTANIASLIYNELRRK
jgi:hypothetical protein